MKQRDRLRWMITYLLEENAQGQGIEIEPLLPLREEELYYMWRGLLNTRLPYPIGDEFLKVQDDYLQEDLKSQTVMRLSDLEPVTDSLYLWQGDITKLEVDAITNAANSEFLGCFIPNHHCIDNEIQSKGGYQIRLDCYEIRSRQGRKEAIGKAKVTPAYNLPSQWIIHTVGPIAWDGVTEFKKRLLAQAYRSVLAMSDEIGAQSLALSCISTGQFGFPKDQAAQIAIQTTRDYLKQTHSPLKVVFNVFLDEDYTIYHELLKQKEI
ncbi:protein-ADP-ribose hydrolase [Hutsoniella sourekii]